LAVGATCDPADCPLGRLAETCSRGASRWSGARPATWDFVLPIAEWARRSLQPEIERLLTDAELIGRVGLLRWDCANVVGVLCGGEAGTALVPGVVDLCSSRLVPESRDGACCMNAESRATHIASSSRAWALAHSGCDGLIATSLEARPRSPPRRSSTAIGGSYVHRREPYWYRQARSAAVPASAPRRPSWCATNQGEN